MLPLVAAALTALRNESHTEDWVSFSNHLNHIVNKCFALGLQEDMQPFDHLKHRGDDMIRQGGHPAAVLRVFAELLPNALRVSRETTFIRDRGKLKAISKPNGASGAASGAATGYPGPSHYAAHHAASVAASSTALAPLGRVLRAAASSRGGGARYPQARSSVSLPFQIPNLPPALTGRRAANQGRSNRGRGRGATAPPPPPSHAVAIDRENYTGDLCHSQQAMTFSPTGDRCLSCAGVGRVPPPPFQRLCVLLVPPRHSAMDCTFLPYPG